MSEYVKTVKFLKLLRKHLIVATDNNQLRYFVFNDSPTVKIAQIFGSLDEINTYYHNYLEVTNGKI